MKRLLLLSFFAVLMCSCGSKRQIAKRESQRQKNEHPVVKEDNKISDSKGVKEELITIPKSYASATEAYIDTYSSIAQSEMQLYGIPASITLAQGILESGSGKGRLSREANNHFGIKCHDWTGAKIYHDDDRSQECFRKYNNARYSFRDHSLFLSQRKRYANLFKLKINDYRGWAKGLRAAGYATDKKYPQKLISLIERYELYKFDGEPQIEDPVVVDEVEKIEHVVVQGDTLYSISRKFNITVEELQEYNGLENNDIHIGQILTVKPLPKDY